MNDQARALRNDIRNTRERMSGTLDELGERLSPHRLKQQAKDSIRDATIGRVANMASNTRQSVMDTIRENPIPAAMVGIGLGWLLFNGRRESDRHRDRYGGRYYGDIDARTPRLRQDDAAGGIGGSVSPREEPGALRRVTHRAGEAAGDVGERVTETVSELTDSAQDIARNVADTTRYQARRLEDRFQDSLYDNPLAVGAAALAVGVAAGLALPGTRKESELMGHTRDQLVDRVRDKAEDVGERVQRVAERAADEASVSARDEGLTR